MAAKKKAKKKVAKKKVAKKKAKKKVAKKKVAKKKVAKKKTAKKKTKKKASKRKAAPKEPPKNAFYAQSGGVTAVINASAAGVIEAARKSNKIGKVYAGRNGIIGALTEDLIDTNKESKSAIAALRHTPSGAFAAGFAGGIPRDSAGPWSIPSTARGTGGGALSVAATGSGS